ncbi:MAG: multiubiquitin domain-containing protein [Segetibacter sp.]
MEKETDKLMGQEPQDEIIDVEDFTKDGKKPPVGKKYRVKIDGHYYIFDHQLVTGRELLEKAAITPIECFWLYQKLKDCDFEKIDLKEKVDLAKGGIEHFVVKPTEVFNYFVDNEPETTDEKELTPNQILQAAGLTPVSDYYLVRINSDGSQTSLKDSPNIPLKMGCPAVKFISAFRGETNVS